MWLSHSMLLVNHLLIALCYETKTFIGLSYSLKTHLISNNCRHQQRLRNLLCAHTFFSFHLELIVKEIVLGAHSPTEALTEIHCHKSNLQVLQCHLGFLFVSTDCASHQWYEPSFIVPEIFLTLLVEFALHVICQRTSNCVFLSAQQ